MNWLTEFKITLENRFKSNRSDKLVKCCKCLRNFNRLSDLRIVRSDEMYCSERCVLSMKCLRSLMTQS